METFGIVGKSNARENSSANNDAVIEGAHTAAPGHSVKLKSSEIPSTISADRANARFLALDFVRFLMALCVVLFHYEIFISPNVPLDQKWFGGFDAAVDFFFMLSGFVICHSYGNTTWNFEGYLNYIQRRIARIYPLHLATLFVFIIALGFAGFFGVSINNGARYDLWDIPAQLLLVHSWGVQDHLSFNHVSWSVSAEFFLYLIFPILLTIVRQDGIIKSLVFLICIIALLSFLTGDTSQKHWMSRSYDFGILRAVPSFFLGIILWHLWFQYSPTRQLSWFWPILSTMIALVLMVIQAPGELMLGVFAVCILLTAMTEFNREFGGVTSRVMKTLGDASYGLYMLHPLVGLAMFKVIVPKVSWLTEMPILAAFLAFCLSLVAALISYKVFESPMRRWMSHPVWRVKSPQLPKVLGEEKKESVA